MPPQEETNRDLAGGPALGRETAPVSLRIEAYSSEALFGGEQEVLIRHGGETYRLRITRQGKLILNK